MDTHGYDGTFPLELLAADEAVGAAGDGSGACIVESPDGMTRIERGDLMYRDATSGRLTITRSPLRG